MKGEKLQNAMGFIDEDLCEDAESTKKDKKTTVKYYFKRLAPVAAVLVILITVGAVLAPFGNKTVPTSGNNTTTSVPYDFTIPTPSVPSNLNRPPVSNAEGDTTLPFCVAEARYPAMAQYPKGDNFDYEEYEAWRDGRKAQNSGLIPLEALQSFTLTSMQEFMKTENNENLVYSPVNVFMALSMCAEISGGNSRQQILNLLGAESVEDLRTYTNAVWNKSYCDDGTVKSILANSFWLNDDVTFNKETLRTLCNNYFASSYSGNPANPDYLKAMKDWINAQTGNLLEDEVDALDISPDMIMNLVSTIYFKAKWDGKFPANNTKEDTFYAKDSEIICDFMNRSNQGSEYYWGERFSATSQNLAESGKMWFVLPDEDVEINNLIKDPELQDFLTSQKYTWENRRTLKVNLSLPKFDTESTIKLKEGLENLGVTDCFNPLTADMSPLTEEGAFIGDASHSARVMVDEEGVIATAFTILKCYGTSAPPDKVQEIDFILNRPFLFFIENENGIILFSGVVNSP